MHERTYGFASAHTFSKKEGNQDAVRFLTNTNAGIAAVIVTDGLGSHYGAGLAARVVAESMADDLRALPSEADLDLHRLFKSAHLRLQIAVEGVDETRLESFDWDNAFGTTAICAVETSTALTIGYVGNGGIFHLRGNFNTFSPAQLLPWNAINYLNPHSIPNDGKNALYKLVAPRRPLQDACPTIITLSKDDSHFGDVVLCCTDGIYSYDQVDIGRDDQLRVWISGEESMERLYKTLASFFDGSPSDGNLHEALGAYLQALDDAGLVNDDCSVGVLITKKALDYQAQLQERRKEIIPA